MILSAEHLHKSYSDRPILEDETINIQDQEKVALIGVNGCGKSTLLKILARAEDVQGSITTKKGLRIHLLPQNPVFKTDDIWQEMMEQNQKLLNPRPEFELHSILSKLGLDQIKTPVSKLSGGQQRKLSLALALADTAEFLLLDEPTNHLDEEMITWLENWLIRSKQTILMVTHDRYFLESVCTRIVELDHGHLFEHKGNYQTYLENKELRAQQEAQREKKHRNLYRKELEWVRAGVQARSTKSKSRLERFEQLRKERFQQQDRALELALPSERMGKKTLEWKDLSFGYTPDKTLFQNFSYHCKRTDRIGLTGPNGCGKSTFLKLLNEELRPLEGTIEVGSTIRIGFFRQNYEIEDMSMRVLDYIEETAREIASSDGTHSASVMLERFLFDKNKQYLPIERLSGGERRRLYLLKILAQRPNILLLDEPTNDLDLITLEVLEDYLDEFPGIVIVVSHDRYFLDRICTELFAWQPDHSWKRYTGGYSDYLARREDEQKSKKKPGKDTRKKRVNLLTYMEKKELESLPQKMEELESQIADLDNQMGQALNFDQLRPLSEQRDALSQELEQCEERWMDLESRKEEENRTN